MGRFTAVESVCRDERSEVLRASAKSSEPVLLFVPSSVGDADAERARLQFLATRGVPELDLGHPECPESALVLADMGQAAPLATAPALPPPALLAGFTQMLSMLSHVHGRCQGWLSASTAHGIPRARLP